MAALQGLTCHRREYLATRTLLRSALSHFRPIPPAAWRFRKDSYGKPFIEPDCGLQFNLSNSDGLVVCLISEGAQVGVDVESPARSTVMIEVADKVFSPGEKAQLNELDGAAKAFRSRFDSVDAQGSLYQGARNGTVAAG